MNPLLQQIGERGIDRALTLDAAHAREAGGDDLDREVAFAARIVARMAAVQLAVVANDEMRWSERFDEAPGDFFGHGAA